MDILVLSGSSEVGSLQIIPKRTYEMKKLQFIVSSFSVFLWASCVFGQASSLDDARYELELSREFLRELEDTAGNMSQSLVEPIEQLADNLMALAEFDEAHSMLDRALQITRVNQGLYSQNQLPFLYKKIGNYANQGNWVRARQQMEHLLWLYQTKPMRLTGDLVTELLQFANFHLRAIVEDAPEMQAYHFRQATQIKWMALGLAERIWGEADPRMVPVLYSQLIQFHLQKVAVKQGGSTGYALREVLPGSGIVRERLAVRNSYYFTGLALLNRLQKVYANAEPPNLEGLAMSNLYLADWQILNNRPEEALASYRLSYRRMLEAGIEPELISELFKEPLVLPEPEFHPTVSQALKVRANRTPGDESGGGANTPPSIYLSFSEWSHSFPNARNPVFSSADDGNSNFALFSFSLTGMNEVSRWIRGRYTSSVSMVNEAELLEQYITPAFAEESLLEKLSLLRFRPKLIDGEAQEASGLLKYHLATDTGF